MLLEGDLRIAHLQWVLECARDSKGYYSDSHFQHFVNSFSKVFLLTSQANCGSATSPRPTIECLRMQMNYSHVVLSIFHLTFAWAWGKLEGRGRADALLYYYSTH